ncbi:MAG: hypothetical protein NWE91_01880 [Candidatus Bathyarchaeota archaeon]|nr:hypothetical protein [Candidatus Bathyarchaeota archaeon]
MSSASKRAQKAWENNPRIGSQAMLSGEFGESFIAYLLSKEDVDVVRASTVGIDLFAIDSLGKIFPKREIVGISVKARISKQHKNFKPTIPIGSKKVLAAEKTWGIAAWIGIVVGSKDKTLAAFVFPFKDLPALRGKAVREDVVAVSELYKDTTKKVKRLF